MDPISSRVPLRYHSRYLLPNGQTRGIVIIMGARSCIA